MLKPSLALIALLAAAQPAAGQAPAPDNLADLFAVGPEGFSFHDLKHRIDLSLENENGKLRCELRYSAKAKLHEEIGEVIENSTCTYDEKTRTLKVRSPGGSPVTSVEGIVDTVKTHVLWQRSLKANVRFKDSRTELVEFRDPMFRLQNKPKCFLSPSEPGFETETVHLDMAYANDNEDYVAGFTQPRGWSLVGRTTDYPTKSDTFTILVGKYEGLGALEVFSNASKVTCAHFERPGAGAPPIHVTDIPLGSLLGSSTALPVHGVDKVSDWLKAFFNAGPVRATDVRLGRGAQYFVSVVAPSRAVKFDDDTTAWIRLNLDISVSTNISSDRTVLVDIVNVAIQDAKRAKAPTDRSEPPEGLFELLDYWAKDGNEISPWGKKMDRWQATFATFLAGRYKGRVSGGQ